jgi:hypothetical protein
MTPLENELDKLLGYVCKEWGFCLSSAKAGPIVYRSSITDDEFASAVLTAEGLTPPEYSEWYKPLKRRFQQHFGRASVAVSDFKL